MILLLSVLVLVLILWVLFTPIVLRIDTRSNLYTLRWRGIGSLELHVIKDELLLQLRIWFWKKDFHPFQKLLGKEKASKKKKRAKGGRGKKNWKKKFIKLLQSFQVKQFRLVLDTDNYIQNSYLFPLFHFLSRPPWQLSINYQGDSALQLHIENRLFRLLKAIIF